MWNHLNQSNVHHSYVSQKNRKGENNRTERKKEKKLIQYRQLCAKWTEEIQEGAESNICWWLQWNMEEGKLPQRWTADLSLACLYMMNRDKICSRQSSNFSFQLFHHHFLSFVLKKGLLDSSPSPEYITG